MIINYDEIEIKKAFEILEIENDEILNLDINTLRNKYLKLALKYHPDKNNNSLECKEKFQEINSSYNLIIESLNEKLYDNIYKDIYKEKEENTYINILLIFIKKIIMNYEKNHYNDIYYNDNENIKNFNNINKKKQFIEIIKNIIINTFFNETINNIEKEKLLEIYNILYKYKLFFKINNETLENLKNIIRQKYKDSDIYIINPTLDLMLENSYYKLVINEEIFLIPLWHNELHYSDKNNKSLIVLIEPILNDDIEIDENNNIIIIKNVNIEIIKELMNTNNNILSVEILNLKLEIPLNKLVFQKIQYYRFKNKGLSKIDENDIYNTKNKGDIIIKIIIDFE